jgi:D-methionine transport system substrate-binding protein
MTSRSLVTAVPRASRRRLLLGALSLATALVLGHGYGHAADQLKVGVMSGSEEEILEVVKQVAAKDGLELEVVAFSDYVLPNEALNAGELDANAFQHVPYLDNQIAIRGYDIVPVGNTIVTPIGAYSNKLKNLDELATGARVGIPNDPTNGGRALLLLQAEHLITLADGVGLNPTVLDITENPRELEIVELDAAQLSRALDDVDAAVINTNFALEAGLDPQTDAIAQEARAGNPYANVIAVRTENKDDPAIRKFVQAYESPEVAAFLEARFKGAILPAW